MIAVLLAAAHAAVAATPALLPQRVAPQRVAPQRAAPTVCTTALCDADRLRPFFDKLARRTGRPVRIVQLGDSHTAGDQLTGAWRRALQSRYGAAGRGTLPPGRPYAGYLTRGVTASQSPDWTVSAIFGRGYSAAGTVPVGLSNYSLTSATPGAALSIAADDALNMFDRFTVCGWQAPGGGTVRLTAGITGVDWSLDGPAGPACRTLDTTMPVSTAGVRLLSGAVTLTSWATERPAAPGVILSNLGTVGAQFVHLERTDSRLFAAELAQAAPDLIVVAFGTNEAFKPNFSAIDYDATLRRGIGRIRAAAPGVPILLIGAPDTATNRAELLTATDGTRSACPDADGWAPPLALATVQAIQRARAHELGLAFWDWGMSMGGACTADGRARAVPPAMRGDRVHFTTMGASEIARLLQTDLDAAMAAPTR